MDISAAVFLFLALLCKRLAIQEKQTHARTMEDIREENWSGMERKQRTRRWGRRGRILGEGEIAYGV